MAPHQATARSLLLPTTASIAIAFFTGCGASNLPGSSLSVSGPTASAKTHRLSQNGVDVHPSQVGAQVSSAVLGAGMAVWFNITQKGMAQSLITAGMTTTRWPGGKAADRYHWQTNTNGAGICNSLETPNAHSTFDNFMADIASPAHLDVAITVNYGSNPQCTGGADPTEAADWVTYANVTKGYNLTWWTVGNEQYTKEAFDLRSEPQNPTQYAQIVSSDYYQQMKAASPIPINVCVDATVRVKGWDATLFSQANYDCVEMHYYPQAGSDVNDTFLLTTAVQGITAYIKTMQGELAAAGRAGTPIYLGEIGSATAPGDKQEMSITQALYAGQVIGELLNDGIARATWHLGYGSCDPPSKGGDFSKAIYGWQNFGGGMIFSDGPLNGNCGNTVPLATLLPTAVTFEMASHFVRNGEHMLGVSVTGMPDVRAYATTYNGEYALMLFNLNKKYSQEVPVVIDGKTSGSGGPVWGYDKALYDASKQNVWNGPSTSTLSSWQNSFSIALPPWSMTVIQTG